MRVLHLSDLHIGLTLQGYNLREDQEYILQQIVRIAEEKQPDAVVIAGDVYDKAIPSGEATSIFDGFVTALSQAVPEAEIMVISGNHDSSQRVDLYRNVLVSHHIHMIGMPPQKEDESIYTVTLSDEEGPVNFYLLPFVKPSVIKNIVGTQENGNLYSYHDSLCKLIAREHVDETQRNVLVSHQFYLPTGDEPETIERADSEIRTVGNVDVVAADVLAPFDYAALGHIHKPMKVGSEVYRYCGTPLPCSVSEAQQQKQVLMVEMGAKGNVEVTSIPLHPLRQVKVIQGTLQEVLEQSCNDYVTVVLTDRVDLDVIDMQTRLRNAFPYLLEIRREYQRGNGVEEDLQQEAQRNPYELCMDFLGEVSEGEERVLHEIMNDLGVRECDH